MELETNIYIETVKSTLITANESIYRIKKNRIQNAVKAVT